jgi:hypothetical protein
MAYTLLATIAYHRNPQSAMLFPLPKLQRKSHKVTKKKLQSYKEKVILKRLRKRILRAWLTSIALSSGITSPSWRRPIAFTQSTCSGTGAMHLHSPGAMQFHLGAMQCQPPCMSRAYIVTCHALLSTCHATRILCFLCSYNDYGIHLTGFGTILPISKSYALSD